jgi:hypothetical protein
MQAPEPIRAARPVLAHSSSERTGGETPGATRKEASRDRFGDARTTRDAVTAPTELGGFEVFLAASVVSVDRRSLEPDETK